jgi:hypothetical protein
MFGHDPPARADAFPYLHKQDTTQLDPGIVGAYGPHLHRVIYAALSVSCDDREDTGDAQPGVDAVISKRQVGPPAECQA